MSSLWTPSKPEFIQNPYPFYARLREEAPVYKTQTNEWVVSRYEDVKSVLCSSEFTTGNRFNWFKNLGNYSREKGTPFRNLPSRLEGFLLFKSGDEHIKSRQLLSRIWPTPEDIEEIVGEVLTESFKSVKGEIDFQNDLARILAAKVILQIIGFKCSDSTLNKLIIHGFSVARVMDLYLKAKTVREIDQSLSFLSDYFDELINSNKPKNGLLTKLIEASERSEVEESSLTSITIFLFIAAVETTSGLLSIITKALCQNPLVWQSLLNNPASSSSILEEVARFDSPVQLLGRYTTNDTKLKGQSIPKGSTLTLAIASANRDHKKFEDPDSLNISRANNAHLTFGAGHHYCLGDRIARTEAILLMKYFAEKYRKISLVKPVVWESHLSIRRPKKLIINLIPV